MSMAMVLQGTRDYLRTTCAFDEKRCDVALDGAPPYHAPPTFVAIDEQDVSVGPEANYRLEESFAISVHVLRRVDWVNRDRRSAAELLRDNPYLAGVATLDDLERQVIVALHGAFALVTAINAQFALPGSAVGDVFLKPFRYGGRGRTRAYLMPEVQAGEQQGHAYWGRELRFRGLTRNQRPSEAK